MKSDGTRHIQDDVLRQRLAENDVRSSMMHSSLHNANLLPTYSNRQLPTVLCNRNIAPFISPDDRPLPLPDKNDKQQKNTSGTTNSAPTENQGVIKTAKPVHLRRSNSSNNNNVNNSNSYNNDGDNSKQFDPLIGVDLLADDSNLVNSVKIAEDVLTEESKPLLKEQEPISEIPQVRTSEKHDDKKCESDFSNEITVGYLQNREGSTSPPVPALQHKSRIVNNNTKLLQDKWQVPAVEKTYIRPTTMYSNVQIEPSTVEIPMSSGHLNSFDIHSPSNRSDNVLTQLGSFRRQLQLEHLRMQERLYHPPTMHNLQASRVQNK